ncbi:MAG TPA: CinA family protein [Beijerinckiaceae bacterium]|nr:CinA family protein [Beijerinckiaceae bacterium]
MSAPIFFDDELLERATALVQLYRGLGLKLATAESCTGGLVAALLTEVAGSSAVLERGFVTYSNEAKQDCLHVPAVLLDAQGAVSGPVARAMAEGALSVARAQVGVAITGIAGPDGGSPEKPVGLVWFACAIVGGETRVVERRFGALGRAQVRRASVLVALDLLEARGR